MTYKSIGLILFLLGLWVLTGCTMNVDAPHTPTVVVSPTLDETAIARLATKTPTTKPTNTHTSTQTSTASVTPSLTASATGTTMPTATHTATSTRTPTQTATLLPTATQTASPSVTATYRPTVTAPPTFTPMPTLTPTDAIAQLTILTATPPPSPTFTPFPTLTPNLTQTWVAQDAPPPTTTPGGIYTLTASPTVPATFTPLPTVEGDAIGDDGTFFDPNAPDAGQDALPIAPVGPEGPNGPAIPEYNAVVISLGGQIVPILTVPDGISIGPAITQGDIFAIGAGGQVAAVNPNGELYVNHVPLTISPASQFGTHPNLSYGDVVWSPDGQRLAFRVDATNPNEFNGIDSGVWVFDPGTNRSWQVFRNTYTGAQLHDQRRVVHINWSPDGTKLAITVETPLGLGTIFMPVNHDANDWIDTIPYADATWTLDNRALIVSGRTWNGGHTVVGRIELDANWTYIEYANQRTNGLYMQAAAQIHDGHIAFLGGPSPDAFALYTIPSAPGAQPTPISGQINGTIVAAEWNADRSAVLVTVQMDGQIQLWIVRIDGVTQQTTLNGDALNAAHWR